MYFYFPWPEPNDSAISWPSSNDTHSVQPLIQPGDTGDWTQNREGRLAFNLENWYGGLCTLWIVTQRTYSSLIRKIWIESLQIILIRWQIWRAMNLKLHEDQWNCFSCSDMHTMTSKGAHFLCTNRQCWRLAIHLLHSTSWQLCPPELQAVLRRESDKPR